MNATELADCIRRARRSLEVMHSHLHHLEDRAEAAYQAGNTELYCAFQDPIEYTEERILVLYERIKRANEKLDAVWR